MKSGDSELRKIHNLEMDLFREFKRICKKYSLRYYAIQGTTLGAIFWKGFIPWDDDMDIGMPAPDYEKFTAIVKKELPSKYAFLELDWCGGKIHNRETTFIESPDLSNPKVWHGVFIDIVPLIALPDDESARKNFWDEMRAYHLDAIKFTRYPKETSINKRQLKEWRKNILRRYSYGSTEYITDFSFGYYYMFRTEGFNSPVLMDFCSEKIPVSSTYDFDLKSRYGKYEKFPPKQNRFAHSSYSIIDIKKSYQEYEKEIKKIPSWIQTGIANARDVEGSYYSGFQWAKQQLETEKKLADTKEYRLGKTILKPARVILSKIRSTKRKLFKKDNNATIKNKAKRN